MQIAVGAHAKRSDEPMIGEEPELIVRHQSGDEMQPYERLLTDACMGDATLFAREDAVEDGWRVVDPSSTGSTTLHEYEPNTWGLAEADALIAGDEVWRNPVTGSEHA